MSPLGAHVSIAKGYLPAFEYALTIGANALQMFTKSPRGGKLKQISVEEGKEIMDWSERKKIRYAVIHSSYLLNFAKPISDDTFEKKSLIDDLESADRIGADGVVVHIGKTLDRDKGEAQKLFVENISRILEETKNLKAKIILENTAGQGTEMGYRLDEFGKILKSIRGVNKTKRLGVCLDTEHMFAAGYDIRDKKSAGDTFETIERHIGWNHVSCIHFNDSKKVLGGRVDRHEDIGRGLIGTEGLRAFKKLIDSETRSVIPFILETPETFSTFATQIKLVRGWN